MANYFSKGYKEEVKYWWLLLILVIALLIIGIIVFMRPIETYLILAAGIIQIVIAYSGSSYVSGRGWMLAGGIIEVILGLILAFNVSLTAITLPIFLGFWLLFRSFLFVGLGIDMHTLKIEGSEWAIATGFLLLICSVIVLMQPFYFGVAAVVVWVGISFLVAGISACILAWQLKNIHKHLK